jgi:hypothetical protein
MYEGIGSPVNNGTKKLTRPPPRISLFCLHPAILDARTIRHSSSFLGPSDLCQTTAPILYIRFIRPLPQNEPKPGQTGESARAVIIT